MKKLFALLLALLMVFSMVACAAKQEPAKTEEPAAEEKTENTETVETEEPAETVTITWGLYETDNLTAELWDYVISEFEAANPGIKIEKIVATGDDRASFWKTLSASGSFPDNVLKALVDGGEFMEYKANYGPEMITGLAKIDGLFAEVPEDIQALFEPATLCTWNGKTTTVPYMKQLRMQCYYNVAAFEELGLAEPETWEDFLNICEALKAAGFFKGDDSFIPVVGVDATANGVEALKEGTMLCTALNNPVILGNSVYKLLTLLEEGKPLTQENVGIEGTIVEGHHIYINYVGITADNTEDAAY